VLAISCDRRVPTAAGLLRADELAAGLPRQAWQRLSAGHGAKGQRYYDGGIAYTLPPTRYRSRTQPQNPLPCTESAFHIRASND